MTDAHKNILRTEEMAVADQIVAYSSQVKALRSAIEKKEHHMKQELIRSK